MFSLTDTPAFMKYPTPYAAARPTAATDAGAQSLARSSTAPSLRPAMGLTGTVAPSSPAKISAAAFVVKRGPSIRPSPGAGASSPLRSPVPTQAVEQRSRVVDGAAVKRESQLQFTNMGYRPSSSPSFFFFFSFLRGHHRFISFDCAWTLFFFLGLSAPPLALPGLFIVLL